MEIEQKMLTGEELNKVKTNQMVDLLHRSLLAISFIVNGNKYCGSGILISKNMILTCAHNLYDYKTQKEGQNFKIYLGANGEIQEKDYYEVESFRFMKQYKTSETKTFYDFGVIKLKKQVKLNEFLKLVVPCQKCLIKHNQQHFIKIYGYPSKYQNYIPLNEQKTAFKLYQYGITKHNAINNIEPDLQRISYVVSTYGGESGSPVVMKNKIIAIHTSAPPQKSKQYNFGRLIDNSLIEQLQKWVKEVKGEPFKVSNNFCDCHKQKIKSQTTLSLKRQQKKQIDLSDKTDVKSIQLSFNKLQSLNVSKNINLVELYLKENYLQHLDVSNNIYLTTLVVSYNKLIDIDLSKNIHLINLDLSHNRLQEINVKKNTKLVQLKLKKNKLAKIILSYSPTKKIDDYISIDKFNLTNQNSETCKIQVEYKKDNNANYGKLKQKWANIYRQTQNQQFNKHQCKYIFEFVQKQ